MKTIFTHLLTLFAGVNIGALLTAIFIGSRKEK